MIALPNLATKSDAACIACLKGLGIKARYNAEWNEFQAHGGKGYGDDSAVMMDKPHDRAEQPQAREEFLAECIMAFGNAN